MFEIHLFGTTSLHSPGRPLPVEVLPSGKPRQLLEMLALGRGAVVTEPVLVDQLWAGAPPPHAVATLGTCVAALRRALQPGVSPRDSVVRTDAGGYRLDDAAVRLDLDLFDAAVATARRVAPAEALPWWEHATALSARRVLEHEPRAAWARTVREEYHRRGVDAAVHGAEAALATDRIDHAIDLARRAVARDPLTEDGWQVLIEGYDRAGRQAEAAGAAASCLEALASGLGVYPSPRTRRLLGIALCGMTASPSRRLSVAAGR